MALHRLIGLVTGDSRAENHEFVMVVTEGWLDALNQELSETRGLSLMM
jgi:hypothetical protein